MTSSKDVLRGLALAAVVWTGACAPLAAAPACGVKSGLPPRTLAIALAVQGQREAAARAAGNDPFIQGFVSYVAGDYERAVERFTAYAQASLGLKQARERTDSLARAGYWASEALAKWGHAEEAAQMRAVTVSQHGTYYALLIDSRSGLPGGRSYPRPELLYTDARAGLALTYAIGREESGFNPSAKSGAGAHGAMQMLHSTAERVANWVGMHADPNKVDHDLNYNAALGSTYLGWLMERYTGYAPLAAAAYNAGEGCADVWISRLGDPRSTVDPLIWVEAIPIYETRIYVQRVMSSYIVYLNGQEQAQR